MYLEYYDLKEKPFAITPDPDFIYLNDTFRQGFNEIVYAVQNRLGLAVIIGEVGTGKTTLARAILRELRDKCKTAYIINPALSFEELVSAILRDLGEKDLPEGREALLTRLNEFLLDAYHQGKAVVVFIDEAHLLEEKELEKIRLLSNLETNKEKLLQLVLVGQPELGKTLSKRSMRQLRDRIVVQVGLEPFKPSEVCDYIYHRLSLAGDAGALTFTPRACKKIAKLSGGIPRRINLLCDRALLAAYARRTFEITPKLVKEAAKDINREFPQEVVHRERRGIGWSGWVLIFIALCVGGVFYINQTFFGYSPRELLGELLSVGKSVPQVIRSPEEGRVIEPPLKRGSASLPEETKPARAGGERRGEKASKAVEAPKPVSEKRPAPERVKRAEKAESEPKVSRKGQGEKGLAPTPGASKKGVKAGGEEKKQGPRKSPSSGTIPKKERGRQSVGSTGKAKEKGTSPALKAPGAKGSTKASQGGKVAAEPSKERAAPVVPLQKGEVAKGGEPGSQEGKEAKKPIVQEEPILSPETEKAIEGEVERWKSAMEALDEATLKAMYDPSLHGELEKRLSLMRSGGEEREIRIENLRITPLVNGDVRVTFEQQYLSMRYSDYGLTTLVFRKKGGKWIIVGAQWKSL